MFGSVLRLYGASYAVRSALLATATLLVHTVINETVLNTVKYRKWAVKSRTQRVFSETLSVQCPSNIPAWHSCLSY